MNLRIYEIFGKKYPKFCMGVLFLVWVCLLASSVYPVLAVIGFISLILNFTYIIYKLIFFYWIKNVKK